MGQEHISYIMGFSDQIRIDYLCDPVQQSLDKAQKIMNDFAIGDPVAAEKNRTRQPMVFTDEDDLLARVDNIDLLVIASPNYKHTGTLLRWGRHDLTILVEKPVAVNQQQHDDLVRATSSPEWKARVWVAMEYRFIPAIAKLLELAPTIGEVKMVRRGWLFIVEV
jgi:myo-inositol 2-dehydrogenase / D-chiro-inositol 1-dehydrogenase